jgi:hypothetical protein
MVVVECFVVTRSTGCSLTMSIGDLRKSLDENAPAPFYCSCPNGIPFYIVMVDFHKLPAVVCGRLGWDFFHVCFSDIPNECYISSNRLILPIEKWVRLFMNMWSRELVAPTNP